MRKLVLYSDQIDNITLKIDNALIKLINKENPKVGYIPSCSDPTRKYFNERVRYYKKMGVNDLLYFDLDEEYDDTRIGELLSCDAIHLSGGNTFYFLSLMKKRGFLEIIRDYVHKGGVLIGISAGAIMMSKDINVAQFGDQCNVSLENREALGLVDFDFMPHWDRDNRYLEDLLEYSKENNRPIYLCHDGDGIVVNGDDIEFIGNIYKIQSGKLFKERP